MMALVCIVSIDWHGKQTLNATKYEALVFVSVKLSCLFSIYGPHQSAMPCVCGCVSIVSAPNVA